MNDFQATLRAARQIRHQGQPILLLLDYDGTLVEIAPRPELARPTPALLKLLGRLTALADLKVMVVSGRPLRELQDLLPVPGLDFLGSHGGEALIDGRLHPWQATAVDKGELARWRAWLEESLRATPGWWIERKAQGFALHYRQVTPEHIDHLLRILTLWERQVRQEGRWQLLSGKKVLEVLPWGVSKGSVIQKILLIPRYLDSFPIYLGDDITDESAFQVLQGRGLTIKVGRPASETAASHVLPDPEAVRRFLGLLAPPAEDCT
jgi:trehalose 6-phosphate phosphatase